MSIVRAAQATLVIALVLLTAALPLEAAQKNGSIAGRVTDAEGRPVADAGIQVVALHRRVAADSRGEFVIPDVPPGRYLVEVASPVHGSKVESVTVAPGLRTEMRTTLELRVYGGEIVVTASAEARTREELARPVNVVDQERLDLKIQPSLGETLAQENGITATTFGAGASKPVIRGLGDDRIRILQSGVGVGDASQTSPDHAIAVDPIFAERIEVIRGPAALLYGSSGIGGVVNIIDRRIPEYVPTQLEGNLDLRVGSAADEKSAAAALDDGAGRWAWHADALHRESGDYEIPKSAEPREAEGEGEEGEEPAHRSGVLANSFVDTQGGALGLSYIPANGFVGLSVSGLDRQYGLPPRGDEVVSIDQQQRRLALLGELNRGWGPVQSLRLRFGRSDYEHREIEEGGGTTFLNDFWEARGELIERRRGDLSGSLGVQAQHRSYSAFGEEEFLVPPSVARNGGVFTFQEIAKGHFKVELGGRYERQRIDVSEEELPDRSFSGLSGSFALTWRPGETYSLALSVSRSIKFPSAEELYSNGFCIGTQTFNLGDPNLRRETSLGTDLALRRHGSRLEWEIDLFHNRFDDFIFGETTGEVEVEEEERPLIQFLNRDAEFSGGELSASLRLPAPGEDRFELQLAADYVRATLQQTGEPLPRTPPLRYGVGLHYQRQAYDGQIEVRRIEEQDRVAADETSTPGSTVLNAHLSRRFIAKAFIYDLLLRGTNLTNAEVRNHVSILKDLVPLPGRDISLSCRLSF